MTWEVVNIITGTMSLAFDYQKEAWHQVLFFLAAILLCGGVGSQAWGRSHRFWLCGGIFGLCIWLILCISLLATGATSCVQIPQALVKVLIRQAWCHIYHWEVLQRERLGVQALCVPPWVGVHDHRQRGGRFCSVSRSLSALPRISLTRRSMAEETKNPSRNVPNAMTAAMVSTYVLGYIVGQTG